MVKFLFQTFGVFARQNRGKSSNLTRIFGKMGGSNEPPTFNFLEIFVSFFFVASLWLCLVPALR